MFKACRKFIAAFPFVSTFDIIHVVMSRVLYGEMFLVKTVSYDKVRITLDNFDPYITR